MSDLVLYNYELDESAYKVRLLARFLRLDVSLNGVNMFPGAEHFSTSFLTLSPEGRLPVLTDGDMVVSGAEACLTYLATAYDPGRQWLPMALQAFISVQHWLMFSARALEPAILARQSALFDTLPDAQSSVSATKSAFRVMDDHMVKRGFEGLQWFAADHPTIADIALFPSFALSLDFGIDHDEYSALRQWARRLRRLENFRGMPGIPDYY